MPLRIIRVGDEDVIRFDLLIHGGQWNQRMPLQAMFTNRMLREGTRTLTSAAIAEKLDYYGAWLDLSSSVNYGFVTLYSLGKYFPQTIEILASMIKEPTFPEKELNIVTDVNRQQYLVNCQRVEVLARKQKEDYDRITSQDLQDFYQTYYHSDNCSAYVSGKVTDEVLRCIEEHFGNQAWGNTASVTTAASHLPATDKRKRVFIEKEDALQS